MIQKFSKDSKERQILADFYNLCQNFWLVEDNDKYWDNMINAVDDFCKKHDNNRFAMKLGLALIEFKEEELRCLEQI